MVNKKIMLLAPGVVLGALVMAAENPAPAAPSQVNAETFEHVGRQKVYHDSSSAVDKANKLLSEGKYDEALAIYRRVKKDLEKYSGGTVFKKQIEYCSKRIEQCYWDKAGDAMDRADESATYKDFEEAIRLCKEAKEMCPGRQEELDKRIAFYQKRREAAIARDNNSMDKLRPGQVESEYNIQLLIEQGIVLLKRDELMAARRKFEEVLLIDPYNETAVQNLLGINTRLRKAAKIRAAASARHSTGEVEWAGALPITQKITDMAPEEGVGVIDKERPNPLNERLEKIKIKNYDLTEMNLEQMVQDLRGRIRVLKSQADEDKKRDFEVNFVVRMPKGFDARKAPKLKSYRTSSASVLGILKTLEKRGDLTFKVDENAVVIAAKGEPLESLTVKVFPFSLNPDDTPEKLKNAMQAGGQVTFGPGSSLELVPLRNEIVSKNTPSNQKLIERWVARRGDNGSQMVQVMFKFLEVAQNDLDELGFSWGYARRGSNMSFEAGSNSLLRHYANDDANDRFGGSPVPSDINLNNDTLNTIGDGDSTYGFVWNDRKNILAAHVYALDWADSSDILYSPRVTTLGGTVARVDMTEKHYYPGEYEDIDSESTERVRVYVTNPQPTLDDERDLGIKFSIKPEIQGDLIRAVVDFDIKQFDSWLIVDSRNLEAEDDDGEYQKKAVINTRRILTDVTLKDGDTVLIGSISQDLTTKLHDKIPILGDLPLIGRLFQSRYTVSKKNNLLVFMTCKIIGPDGSAARVDKDTGLPKNVGGERGLPVFPRNL